MARWYAMPRMLALLFTCLAFVLAVTAQAGPKADDWHVASIVRNIDLGGSATTLTDVHIVRGGATVALREPASDEDVPVYYFSLSQADAGHVSGIEATARFGVGASPDQRRILAVKDEGVLQSASGLGIDSNGTDVRPHLYSVRLPAAFLRKPHPSEPMPDTTITFSAVLLHASEPLPRSIAQSDKQYVLWRGDAAVMTPYGADTARIKAKAPQPEVLSHSTDPDLGADLVTKSGSTITYGPYKNVPSMLTGHSAVPRASVHYLYNLPMLTIVDAKREAKVSHWRNKLRVQDDYWLRSDGATLKGHFSRIAHQSNILIKREATHIVSGVALNLPPGTEGAYFTDESGNVSTSHFRPTPPAPQSIGTPAHLLSTQKASLLQLQPRYPLLGGWNYTCNVGWGVRLSDGWLKTVSGSRYVVQVPFMTTLKDVAVNQASLRVVLPEGARDVLVSTPFAVDTQGTSKSWSFLDTTGKPVVEISKAHCSERHGGLVTVEYTLTPLDHYRKIVVAILLAVLGVLTFSLGNKVDLSIKA